ncbi:acyl-CoA dehydrogenase family protein [Kitasatospora sp. NPDC057223]|uniref:acyl-CoA dehydrogenase family protein n=1 Tax=Kitasatospora sp. NPDC057223 TaxID=3346055 RepID=UPI00363F0E1B
MTGARAGLRHYLDLGREGGLAAGLAAVLDGLDPAAAAPGAVALLPAASAPPGAELLTHPFAALEGLALVRLAAGTTATGPGLTGPRAAALAAVRIGLLSRMLDAAVRRLEARRFGGLPLVDRQLVGAALADVATEIEVATAAAGRPDAPAEAVRDQHERLTEAGWTTTRLFGAEGYLTDHPVRCLHLSALAADLWLARPTVTEGVR